MSAPKKPEDHKKPKPTVEKIEGGKKVTIDGITVTVLDEVLDDFELLEDLAGIDSGDKNQSGKLPLMLRRILGDEGRQTVVDGLRGKNGRVRVEDGLSFIKDLFGALNPNS